MANWNAWVWLFAWLVLPALLVLAACSVVRHYLFFFGDLIAGLTVVVYCLGPKNLFRTLASLKALATQENLDLSQLRACSADPLPEEDLAACDDYLARRLLVRFHDAIFAPIFWFILLGVFGVVFYRMVYLLDKHRASLAEPDRFQTFIQLLHGVLAWFPARALAAIYALCGHFRQVGCLFRRRCFESFDQNEAFLEACGMAAIQPIEPMAKRTQLPMVRIVSEFLQHVLLVMFTLFALFVVLV